MEGMTYQEIMHYLTTPNPQLIFLIDMMLKAMNDEEILSIPILNEMDKPTLDKYAVCFCIISPKKYERQSYSIYFCYPSSLFRDMNMLNF